MKIFTPILLSLLLGCSPIHRVKVYGGPPTYPSKHIVKPTSNGLIIEVYGSERYQQDRVRRLATSLNFTGQSMPGWWRVVILSRADWEDAMLRYHLEGRTGSAFTVMGQDETFINEEYLFFATDDRVKFTLGHEAGHLICNCQSEERADKIARILTRR